MYSIKLVISNRLKLCFVYMFTFELFKSANKIGKTEILTSNCNIWSAILENGGQDCPIDLRKWQKRIPWPRKPMFSYTTHIHAILNKKIEFAFNIGPPFWKWRLKWRLGAFPGLGLDGFSKCSPQGTISTIENVLLTMCTIFPFLYLKRLD